MKQRRIVCAANRNPDTHDIILGIRHFDHLMRQAGGNQTRFFTEQGFVDQHGIFLDRIEAWKVAESAGQIVYRVGGDTADGGTLYSENLY